MCPPWPEPPTTSSEGTQSGRRHCNDGLSRCFFLFFFPFLKCLFLGHLVDAHVVGAEAGGDGGAAARGAGPQLLPGVGAGAAEAGDVGELERERGGAGRRYDADNDAVAQRARPVLVQLPVDGGGGPGRTEVARRLAERVLVDGDDVLVGREVSRADTHKLGGGVKGGVISHRHAGEKSFSPCS